MDRLDGRITDDEYDKYWQQFRDQIAEADTKISMLQEAEDNYYITSKYILELANKAYELFKSSEVEERRQLIKLVLQNLRVEEDKVLYDAVKPFDTLLKYSDYQFGLPADFPTRTEIELFLSSKYSIRELNNKLTMRSNELLSR